MNQSPQIISSRLRQFVTESLPMAALLHSYLVELQWDPAFKEERALAEFADNLLHELRHHMALWGGLLRLDRGDPTAWSNVGLNLARLLQRRQITAERAARLPTAVRQDPRGQAMLSLVEQANGHIQGYLPLILQTIRQTGWSSAAPQLFQQ